MQIDYSYIETFLERKSDRPKMIVIYGPTACGKTGYAIEIWKKYNYEIISADSRQIYRWLDIGTGKVTSEEMDGVPHHMIDIVDPDTKFSVFEFRDMVHPILETLWKKWSIPVICGGTGLYIDSIVYERDYASEEPDWSLRDELEALRLKDGNIALWKRLESLDPEYAHTLHPNNYRYVMRGIEVFLQTGSSKSVRINAPTPKYDTLFFSPYTGDRDALYSKINTRIQWMFDDWLIDEVIYNKYKYGVSAPWLLTIGYEEVLDHLAGKTTKEECIALVQQHNRNYAKRQITWNKKYDNGNLNS